MQTDTLGRHFKLISVRFLCNEGDQSETMKPVFSEKFVGSTYSDWLVMTESLFLMQTLPPDIFYVYW